MCPGGLAAQPFGVIPRRYEQKCRGVGADPVEGEKPGGMRGDERNDELVEAPELAVEEFGAPSQLPQRDAGGIADDLAAPGPQRRQFGDQSGGRLSGEEGPPSIATGPD